jgi:hypothetical protein
VLIDAVDCHGQHREDGCGLANCDKQRAVAQACFARVDPCRTPSVARVHASSQNCPSRDMQLNHILHNVFAGSCFKKCLDAWLVCKGAGDRDSRDGQWPLWVWAGGVQGHIVLHGSSQLRKMI